MIKYFLIIISLLFVTSANAAVATIFVDTGGCNTGSSTQCSGTTDSATATASGASATITCSATSGPGAAPGCSLSGTPSLAGIATDGSQAIFVNCATNANQKIFFINAIDDALDLVGTSTTPTGCTASTSDWGIGGRKIWTPAHVEAALRAGDTVLFNNSPAASAATQLTVRTAGDSTTGFINFKGKTGVRPILETTAAATAVILQSGTPGNIYFNNLELRQSNGTSGTTVTSPGANWIFDNIKFNHTGGGTSVVVSTVASGDKFINSEFVSCGGDCVTNAVNGVTFINNYFHDGAANGITVSGVNPFVVITGNIFDTMGSKGVSISGAQTAQGYNLIIAGNTFYNNTVAGLQVDDADTAILLYNNIFQNDGTHANVIWTAGNAETVSLHQYNVFFASGGTNLTNLTPNSTESTSDPLMSAPSTGNFSIGNASPAAGTGTPGAFLGSTTTGFKDMGAVQRQVTASGTAAFIAPGIH